MADNIRKKLVLQNVRLSFPSLWQTETYKGNDTGKYVASFLVDKTTDAGKALPKMITEVAEQAFGKPIPKKVEYCLKDGDQQEYDGYAGMWAIKANTKYRPTVIDRQKRPVTEEDDLIYPGCYVNASLEVYSYDGQYGKRVGCSLNAIQFVRDGESFVASSGDSLSDFDVLDEASSASVTDDFDDDDSPFA